MVVIACMHHSFIEMAHQWHLWHFEINADISILDKSVILGLPFCVFAGYSVLTYMPMILFDLLATRQNKNAPLALESFFMTGYVKYY